ncbi:MAG TPA: hypothetical protein VGO76_15465 [Luteibacter sp.]|jgi:hypothetical protein|nr:hypothetical protein [Luteibacter sp.]
MVRSIVLGVALVATLGVASAADASGRFGGGGIRRNATGGVTAGHVTGSRGPLGSTDVHGRRTVTDGQGDSHTTSAGAALGAFGGSATRSGETTRNPDGSASHQSGFTATGRDGGTVTSTGQATRNSDGSGSFSRQTTGTGANGGSYARTTSGATGQGETRGTRVTGANGNSYNGQTTVSNGGITHTGGCTNASGQAIACR